MGLAAVDCASLLLRDGLGLDSVHGDTAGATFRIVFEETSTLMCMGASAGVTARALGRTCFRIIMVSEFDQRVGMNKQMLSCADANLV